MIATATQENGVSKRHGILGVTIGVGEKFERLASLAAESFVNSTGLPVRILSQENASRYPGSKVHHLKFEMFTEITDADTLFYFDADTVFLKPIDTSEYVDRNEFIAVRDLVDTPFIRAESRRAKILTRNYFNSGLFILNRRCHAEMLQKAKALYKTIKGSPFFDQTALNAARGALKLPIHFLPKKFNHLFFDKCREPDNVVVGHMPGIESRPFETLRRYYQFWSSHAKVSTDETNQAEGEVCGKLFNYERVGYDSRKMSFEPGGLIGIGRAGCERRWMITAEPEPVLWILGHGQPTCALVSDQSGTWHGRWMWHEQMPIRLSPCKR